MEDLILNILHNTYANYIYFADKNSFVRNEINNLSKIVSLEDCINFIVKSTILAKSDKIVLQEALEAGNLFEEEEKEKLLNYFKVKKESVNKIELLDNVLPFNYVNNLIIDKSLLKNLDNFNLLRKEIGHIESFILENRHLPVLNTASIILINNDTNSGEYNKSNNSITLKTNHLNPSSLYHEFFHMIDENLSKKYGIEDLYSNTNKEVKELKLFNQYVSDLDKYISSSNNGRENLELYYKKYLGKNFEDEIKDVEDVKNKIKNLHYVGFKLIG